MSDLKITSKAQMIMNDYFKANGITDKETQNKKEEDAAKVLQDDDVLTEVEADTFLKSAQLYDEVLKSQIKINNVTVSDVSKIIPKMVSISGGTFPMGDAELNKEWGNCPVHSITVGNFQIGETSITNKQWREVMAGTKELAAWEERMKYYPECAGDNQPVVSVSYLDAIKFCNKVNEKAGLPKAYNEKTGNLLEKDITKVKGYRLPTEAEREYSASNGGKNKYGTNDGTLSRNNAVYNQTKPAEVKSKPANPLGVYDLSGNVWEWCTDRYNENYYLNSPKENPVNTKLSSAQKLRSALENLHYFILVFSVPPISSGNNRVLRGGSWDYYGDGKLFLSSWRHCENAAISAGTIGFRLGRTDQ